ncbi:MULTISPECIES: heme-binding protein [unclassified Bradyrhizobium]|nr:MULTISPECIES: heme-binding protein [unclassified Bradyrhizobium]
MVAITFSGSTSDGIIADKTRQLRDYAQRKGLTVTGSPLLAFYNPPWTLPMLRRNEVMLACSC